MAIAAQYIFNRGSSASGQLIACTNFVVSATVASGGTGGTNGTQTVTGTLGTVYSATVGGYTATFSKFSASVLIAGGTITKVLSITVPGGYAVNPPNLAAEPVSGAGLSGATLSLVMNGGHNLIANQQYNIYPSFQSVSVGVIPSPPLILPSAYTTTPPVTPPSYSVYNFYTATVIDAYGIWYTSFGAGLAAVVTGSMSFLNTGGAVYIQTGRTLTITYPGHGFGQNSYVQLQFVGGSYVKDGNYLINSTPDANTLVVTALNSAGTSGGVAVLYPVAAQAALAMTFGGKAWPQAKYLRAVAPLAMTFGGKAWPITRQIGAVVHLPMAFTGRCYPVAGQRLCVAALPMTFTGRCHPRVSNIWPASAVLAMSFGWKDNSAPRAVPVIPASTGSISGRILLALTCQPTVTRQGATVTDILDDAAKLTGFLSAADMIDTKQRTLVDALNAALQLMFERAEYLDYFSLVTRDYTVPAAGDTPGQIVLPDDVQEVKGYLRVKADKRPLVACGNMSDIERYPALYLGATDDTTIVHAWYADRNINPASAYGYTNTLYFAPVPQADTVIQVNVTLNPPRITWDDYLACTQLSVPHRWVEAILQPLVRERMAATIDFAVPAALPSIQAAATKARATLGLVDPKTTNRAPKPEPQPAAPAAAQ